jgi:ubiquinone/menaquinone biosynthesis C-methylase UbiE
MNRIHRWYCRSSRWKRRLENDILPWSLGGVDLGDEVLEIGPGPGLTTGWLRHECKNVTCIEVDPRLASALRHRTVGTNISVQCGDATEMPYRDHSFSAVVSLTMLHHIPSQALQDRMFAEVYRVLRPRRQLAHRNRYLERANAGGNKVNFWSAAVCVNH